MFTSIDDVQRKFERLSYISSKEIATCVYLATKLGKPILVEGPAGVGKTELAKVLAAATGAQLIRLQCYEGLDEGKALYEWEYAKQLLYTQILKDKIADVIGDAKGLTDAVDRLAKEEDAFFSEKFLLERPLLRAITAHEATVLLIDEIDKSDHEFEAFLLEILSDFQVTVPELGTFKSERIPMVVLTSNNARELSDALKRRCLHLYIDFPTLEQEMAIVQLKVPGVGAALAHQVAHVIQGLRDIELKKKPSIAETLDWARALTILNVDSLGREVVEETLNLVLKHESDTAKAKKQLVRVLAEMPKPGENPGENPSGDADGGETLH
ncbi:MAG: MoxR family ATPase [Myxococcales bacterium]|nr:MoxR family ATPase [Myxococcales bacterium]